MAQLFSPLQIRDIVLKNRLIVSPMCQYSSVDGFANDWHFVHLGSRAVGGAALIFTEAIAVSPEGRISPDDLGIWKDEHITELKRITTFIEAQGSIVGTQLAHAGRKASTPSPWKGKEFVPENAGGWNVVAPSSIAFNEHYALPVELTKESIVKVVNDFKAAAERALKAGFKVIEIHAAHGYLINEFLSPLANKRTDEYGGSFENRIRLLIEIVEAIRCVWPAGYPLFTRISSVDYAEAGWTIEDSIKLATILKEKGVDLMDCSSGGVIGGVKIPVGPSYQVPFSKAVKEHAHILTGAVGMITDAQQGESILVSGEADLIFMAREMLRDPYFPLRAAHELGYKEIKWPKQYERAKIQP